MTKNELANRVSERTGLDTETSMAVLTRIEAFNIFSKKENDSVRAAIAETAGCDEDRAEDIREDIISVMKGEAKHLVPKAIVSVAALFVLVFAAVKIIKIVK